MEAPATAHAPPSSLAAIRRSIMRRHAEATLQILVALERALDEFPHNQATVADCDNEEAPARAVRREWGLSEVQAEAVLDIRLRRSVKQHRVRLDEEVAELREIVAGRYDDDRVRAQGISTAWPWSTWVQRHTGRDRIPMAVLMLVAGVAFAGYAAVRKIRSR